MQLLEAGSTAAVRFGKLLEYMHESKEPAREAEWEKAVDEAIEKVLAEERPKWVSEVCSIGLSCGQEIFIKGAIYTKFLTLSKIQHYSEIFPFRCLRILL
jgi:hypothetical protein